jgi:Uncharacterized protein conserved in bacteria
MMAGVDIDLLCKVVDNYGDIGVVYRLARALSELPDPPALRLVVDDLRAFRFLEPSVDPAADVQIVRGVELYRWDGGGGAAAAAFRSRRPKVVLECFACGRPDWLEDILFDPSAGDSLIVNLEYLTAEPYAVELHRMPSLTRSARVRKANFLPGFVPGTGGLILDAGFAATRFEALSGRVELRRRILARLKDYSVADADPRLAEAFWFPVFSYERDYGRVVADMAAFARGSLARQGLALLALVAAGKSQACFMKAWAEAGRPFAALELPFLPQAEWDALLLSADFSIVRGEDSWSRAALSGRPFLWQAYPQEGRYQMVKVKAFLELLMPYVRAEDYAPLERLYLAFNDRDADSPGERGTEDLASVLRCHEACGRAFRAFSAALKPREDLAAALVTFLSDLGYNKSPT